MKDLTQCKCRLRGYPESEVRGLWRDERDKLLRGWARTSPDDDWSPEDWDERGYYLYHTHDRENDEDLIPAPPTVKSEGFWLAVRPSGAMFLDVSRIGAEGWANVGEHADPEKRQGWIKYFPPMEYEAGSIIDPREEG